MAGLLTVVTSNFSLYSVLFSHLHTNNIFWDAHVDTSQDRFTLSLSHNDESFGFNLERREILLSL